MNDGISADIERLKQLDESMEEVLLIATHIMDKMEHYDPSKKATQADIFEALQLIKERAISAIVR